MKTFNKRIMFLVSSQTLIPHGGIGQFAKSFCELMNENSVKVDIVTDKEIAESEFTKSLKANIISPLVSLRYTEHSNIFMYGDTFCYERMANFRNAIVQALESNLYDAIICNTYETVQVASAMGLEDVIQVIAYTHLESQIFKDTKNPFLHSTNELMRQQLKTSGIFVGTQSKFNQLNLESTDMLTYHLPIPITERKLLEEYKGKREGVLFVGRWEEGKNPELFIDLIEQTKLPAKVMTSPNGVKKFEDRLKKIGVKYDVRASIVGQEKVDFICSSRVAFNPSIIESYGMAFYEQIIQLPTFCLQNQRWTKNFDGHLFFETNKKQMAEDVLGAYERFATAKDWYENGSSLKQVNQREGQVFTKWDTCFNDFKPKQSNNNTAKICSESTVTVRDYIQKLNRKVICIDDIRSVLTNKHKFRVIYTDNDTYLTKDPSFNPEEETTDSLFDFG